MGVRAGVFQFSAIGLTLLTSVWLSWVQQTNGFYLPGIAPVNYEEGEDIEVIANKLTSPKNQLAYGYYSLPVCNTRGKVRTKRVNLGQILSGERALPTEFQIQMHVPQECRLMCVVTLEKKMAQNARKYIEKSYSVRLNLDNMPVVIKGRTKSGNMGYHFGYPVGRVDEEDGEKVYINNYLRFRILYHSGTDLATGQKTSSIVGFEVEARSVKFELGSDGQLKGGACPSEPNAKPLEVAEGVKVPYVYDVEFEESQIEWATRWDPLLEANPDVRQIQWFSIVNSIMVGIFLTALVGVILLRTVLKDFVRYNQVDQEALDDELSGWKIVHTDVFRPPKYIAALCILVGTGSQVFTMAAVTQAFALAGFLSPANRGALMMAMLFLWVAASTVSGFSSARLYASLEGTASRKVVTIGTAFVFPGITFGLFFFLNLILWIERSQGAVPFFTLILLLLLWLCLGVPLVFFGAYLGYKQRPYDFPVRTNQIPRVIPAFPMPFLPYIYILSAGIIPFCTVFMELVFILNSIWQNQIYYMFGFLFIVFVLLTVTSGEMSIVFTYLTLSNEDYRWWWQAFLTSGSSGLYVFIYSLYYLMSQPGFNGITFISVVMYLIYMAVISGAFALMTGFIGFQSSFMFVRKIYSVVRIE